MSNQEYTTAAERLAEIGREKLIKERLARQQEATLGLGALASARPELDIETAKTGPDGTLTREQSELLEQLQTEPGVSWGYFGEPDNF